MQGISPMLWFDKEAEEAANLYISIFDNSRVLTVMYYPEDTPPEIAKAGAVAVVYFEIAGQKFSALNGGPTFKFNESVSFVINCDTQAEIDRYWDALLAGGGKESQCGWLKDKYGVSWQITPSRMAEMYSGTPAQSSAVFATMLKMVKLDIATLEEAYNSAAG